MTIHFCYLLEFADGKIYVGMSRTDSRGRYDNRYRQHANDAKRGRRTSLYEAWRKHGAPTQTVLTEHTTYEECAKSEIALIALLGSCDPAIGHNIQRGGLGLHAPKGSRMWNLMQEKVWNNPERNAKLSAASKGKPLPPHALIAAQAPDVKARRSEAFKKTWTPERRANHSAMTAAQMTLEARAYLSLVHTGRADPRSAEGKERQRVAAKAHAMTPEEGTAWAARTRADPETAAKIDAGLKRWRESDENAEHCRRMAERNKDRMQRPVRHVETGLEFPSCSALAAHFGYSHQSYVSRLIAQGKVVRL